MGVRASASFFVEVHSLNELIEAIDYSRLNKLELLVLGGGSNLLFVNDFPGLVIKIGIKGKQVLFESDKEIHLEVGAGENWHDTVLYSISNNWAGLENLSLIPGLVGASPIQNIGAYGVEVKDVLISLEALNLDSLEVEQFSNQECNFGYRDSVFKSEKKGKYVILSVLFKLKKEFDPNINYAALAEYFSNHGITNPTLEQVCEAVIAIRESKLPNPKEIGNTGSFFKNPILEKNHYDKLKSEFSEIPSYAVDDNHIKVPAGWLIEQCGWKGKRIGDAGVHSKQALVIVNHGNASGTEVWNLALKIQESVNNKFGVMLSPEVNIIF